MSQSNNAQDFSEGFTPHNDIFNRKGFYLNLLNVITNSPEDGMVIALDDRWGQGKTTFVKMMHGEINKTETHNQKKVNAIYFDAYSNDFHSDPFIPIAAEFHALFSDPDNALTHLKDKFLKAATRVGAAALTGGLKAVISTSTLGLVNGNEFVNGATNAVKESANELTDNLVGYVEKKITAAKEEKVDIENFRITLSDIHDKSDVHTVFIIDELDRAKPDFSLDLLEKIKHLFSVKHVTFLLVMNKGQFEKIIEKRYGYIDSKSYLSKFVNMFVSLPKVRNADTDKHDFMVRPTIFNYIRSMPEAGRLFNFDSEIHVGLSYLLEVNNCSLREAERCISLMNVFTGSAGKITYTGVWASTITIMTFLKVNDSVLYETFMSKNNTLESMIKELNLETEPDLRQSIMEAHRNMLKALRFHYFGPTYIQENLRNLQNDYVELLGRDGKPKNPFMELKNGFENFSILV